MANARLLEAVHRLDGDEGATDAVWGDRIVGPVRFGGAVLSIAVFLIAIASGPGSVARWGFGLAALALPFLAEVVRPPMAVATTPDGVAVYRSARWRRKPVERVDVIAPDRLRLEGLGLLSDRWSVDGEHVSVPRWHRSRVQQWCEASPSVTTRPSG